MRENFEKYIISLGFRPYKKDMFIYNNLRIVIFPGSYALRIEGGRGFVSLIGNSSNMLKIKNNIRSIKLKQILNNRI